MSINLTRRLTPDEQELEKKRHELTVLVAELAERELELVTLQAELHAFEREYLRVVGVRYAELDEIEAEIAKYFAYLNPKDPKARKQAEKAKAKAQDSKRAVSEDITKSESQKEFKPWETLRQLFREVAKRIHPDLTTDEMERQHRHKLMVEANQAYQDGDEARLQAILQAWNRTESIEEEGISVELTRTIRAIVQVREHLKAIEREINALKQSVLYQLREKVIAAQQEERDLFVEMVYQIERQIAAAKVRLEKLRVK